MSAVRVAPRRLAAAAIAALATLMLAPRPAAAETEIVEVVSPGGVRAWLVEEQSIPIISIAASFDGGEALFPDDKAGLAGLYAAMLEEGAGPYDASAFARRADELAARLFFDADSDSVSVGATMLLQNREQSLELFRLALHEPRFDADALARVKAQIASGIRQDATDPNSIAARLWFKTRFPDDPYGRPMSGTLESVAALGAEDLRDAQSALLTRDGLYIGVVGAITPEELGPILDTLFLPLPESGPERPPAVEMVVEPGVEVVEFDAPQSTVIFGHSGLLRDDPDFMTAYVMNYILGGGGFQSRLNGVVREQRGLAYSVYSYLYPLDRTGLYLGGVGTANERVDEAIALIRSEWARMAAGDVTEEELEAAKRYLIGSFALRFDSNAKIARFLVGAQREELGIDYITRRNSLVEAVTLEDVRRVAARLLDADSLYFVVVGRPEGL